MANVRGEASVTLPGLPPLLGSNARSPVAVDFDRTFEVSGGRPRSYFVPTVMLHQPPVLLAFVGSQATFDFLGRDKSAATCLQRDLPAGKKQHRWSGRQSRLSSPNPRREWWSS